MCGRPKSNPFSGAHHGITQFIVLEILLVAQPQQLGPGHRVVGQPKRPIHVHEPQRTKRAGERQGHEQPHARIGKPLVQQQELEPLTERAMRQGKQPTNSGGKSGSPARSSDARGEASSGTRRASNARAALRQSRKSEANKANDRKR